MQSIMDLDGDKSEQQCALMAIDSAASTPCTSQRLRAIASSSAKLPELMSLIGKEMTTSFDLRALLEVGVRFQAQNGGVQLLTKWDWYFLAVRHYLQRGCGVRCSQLRTAGACMPCQGELGTVLHRLFFLLSSGSRVSCICHCILVQIM